MGKNTTPPSQMLRLDSDLWARMGKEAEANKRTTRQEIELRLKQSLGEGLEKGSWAAVEPRLTPHARALVRLLSLMAGELAACSPAGEDYDYLQRGLSRVLERLGGKEEPSGAKHPAATVVDYWWLRLNNVQELTYENGIPIPMSSEQLALVEIRSDLGIVTTTPAEQQQKKREGERTDLHPESGTSK